MRLLRRKRTGLLLAIGLCVLLLLSWLLRVATWRPLELAGQPPRDGYARAHGVLHVHTNHSDGGGTVEEVVLAARRTGLDFVVVTDHNNLDAKPQEGYHGELLLLVGTEISTTSGYVLGLGIPDPAFRFSGNARGALADIRQLGGTAFAAHPTSPREEFAWRGWGLEGEWGLELVNLDCQWREAGWARLLRAAAAYPVNGRYSLLGLLSRPSAVIENWDALLRQRHAPMIAAADAHSRIALPGKHALRLPSYEALLAVAHTHVLLEAPLRGDFASDSQAVLRALARGRSYVGLDALAPAGGFLFEAVADGDLWTMGDTVPAERPCRLRAGGRLPKGARVVLLRDGQPVATGEGSLECETPGPGVYRVEVTVPDWPMPWVFSNPIYVFGAAEADARRLRALPDPGSEAPAVARMIDDFEGTTVFRAEFDASSAMGNELVDRSSPMSGASAGRMSFRLGDGNGLHGASCALVSRERRDWTGATGLALAIRGDDEYRVHVQIRDENPAGRDKGCAETWFASAKAGRTWQRLAIPFAEFRSTDPQTDGHLDLDKIRLVAFVVDRAADKVGTKGTIWFDEVGIY